MRTASSDRIVVLPPREPGTSVFRWLCAGLRAAILDGRLRPGRRLPASRALATHYKLARGTVVTAYEQLKAEGYVETRIGSGSYVSSTLPDKLLHVAPQPRSPRPPGAVRRRLSRAARRAQLFPATTRARTRAFRTNQPALDLFPTSLWAQVAGRRLRRATVELLRGTDSRGYGPLRDEIANYLSTARGVACTADQVIVVSGVQEAVDLVSRVFLDPGDVVCMEDPGYVGASLAFKSLGARIVRLRVDANGAIVSGLRGRTPRLIYVTPGHQFPLGVTMSVTRRLALLEFARRCHAVILEDDYDGEYRYAGAPVAALQALDRQGVVIYTGSFSKVLFPSLRLGYLVVPPDLVDRVAAVKSIATRGAPMLEQAVLADFMAHGHFGRHIRRMRTIYAERLAVLLESASQRLNGLLDFSPIEAGLQTTAWLCDGVESIAAAAAAERRDVEVTPLSVRFPPGRSGRAGLVLGFAAVDEHEIRRGVGDLAIALEECRTQVLHGSSPPQVSSTARRGHSAQQRGRQP